MYTDTFRIVPNYFLFFFLGLFTVSAQEKLASPLPQSPIQIDFSVAKQYTALKINNRMIDSLHVGSFLSRPNKGQVRQSFQNARLSGQPKVYPFEYQYYIQPSPDRKKYLLYHYDYSQPVLMVVIKILDEQWNTHHSVQLPVDDGLTNHGYWIDNQGYIYAIHTNTENAIYLMRYLPATNEAEWLEVGADVTHRNRFVPFFGGDQLVFVANIVEDAAFNWEGVLVSTFDFQKKRVTDISLYTPPHTSQKSSQKLATGRYEIVSFAIKDGQKLISLQKGAILANQYIYNPYAVLTPLNWTSRKQQVQYGEKIIWQISELGKITEKTDTGS